MKNIENTMNAWLRNGIEKHYMNVIFLASCLTLIYYLKHKEKNGSWLFVKELSVGAWQLP